MPIGVVVGGFFGDEGKGSVVGYLALKDKPEICVRGGVGPNAGHTVLYNGKEYKLRQIPSGLIYEKCRLLIGPGVLVNPDVLFDEIKKYSVDPSRVGIDKHTGIIRSQHIEREKKSKHLKEEIQSTLTGCGEANVDRVRRILSLAKDIDSLAEYIVDVPEEIWRAIDQNKLVLIEGTQGTFLSLYHGTYPFVTSKDVCASAICSDVGVGPKDVDDVIVVFKAYVTRVGAGPLLGELSKEEIEERGWTEYGTVTGRLRRAAPFSFDLARRAIKLNSATQIAITKLDVVFPETAGVRKWDKLSDRAKKFILEIEDTLGVPVTIIRTGKEVLDVIDRR
ncbi:MAG: adenylosuccinate synthetase [Candidatus Njordarchaeota archaeon]